MNCTEGEHQLPFFILEKNCMRRGQALVTANDSGVSLNHLKKIYRSNGAEQNEMQSEKNCHLNSPNITGVNFEHGNHPNCKHLCTTLKIRKSCTVCNKGYRIERHMHRLPPPKDFAERLENVFRGHRNTHTRLVQLTQLKWTLQGCHKWNWTSCWTARLLTKQFLVRTRTSYEHPENSQSVGAKPCSKRSPK